MKVVYSPKGKLAKFFFHKVYQEIEIRVQNPQIFFSENLYVTGSTVQIQGHGTFKYSKYATEPKVNFEDVDILKGPLMKKVKVAKLIDQGVEIGENIKFLGSGVPLHVTLVKIHETDGDKNIKVAGIDYIAPEDIFFNLSDRIVEPRPIIKQGNNYMVARDDIDGDNVPLLVKVERPEVRVEIYRTDKVDLSDYGEIIYQSVSYSFEESTFWEGNINFFVLDSPPEKDKIYRYTVLAKCNNANDDAPIIINYAAVTISQIV